MHTEVLSIHTSALFEEAVQKAVSLIDRGQIVALPTETVYGLAADALNPIAVRSIYEAKQRPSTNPLIIHVASRSMLRICVKEWPHQAECFANSFWPGPLTLVLPKSDCIPKDITAGLDSVAVRWPGHPFMQTVIKKLGRPLAAPSANLANQLSPTSAEHVIAQLDGRIPLIVDGGSSNVGIESTVLDLCGGIPTVLRPGMIHLESLRAIDPTTVNLSLSVGEDKNGLHKPQSSPGLHRKHYAPKARLHCLSWATTNDLVRKIVQLGSSPGKTCVLCHEHIPAPGPFLRVSVIPHDPEAFARALYSELFTSDQEKPGLILVESVPNTHDWHGVRDRLTRASTD